LIAGEFRSALRAYLRGDAAATCPREPDFARLLRALGDAEAQNQIREANPAVKHCFMLIADPNACIANQRNGGRPCPNHPFVEGDDPEHNTRALRLRQVSRYSAEIEALLRVENLVMLRLRQSPHPNEIVALQVLREERTVAEHLSLARAIANEVLSRL